MGATFYGGSNNGFFILHYIYMFLMFLFVTNYYEYKPTDGHVQHKTQKSTLINVSTTTAFMHIQSVF